MLTGLKKYLNSKAICVANMSKAAFSRKQSEAAFSHEDSDLKNAAEDYAAGLHLILVDMSAKFDFLLSLQDFSQEYKEKVNGLILQNEHVLGMIRILYEAFHWPVPDDGPNHINVYDRLHRHNRANISSFHRFHDMLLDFNNQLHVFSNEYDVLLDEAIENAEPNAHMLKFLKSLVKTLDQFMASVEGHCIIPA